MNETKYGVPLIVSEYQGYQDLINNLGISTSIVSFVPFSLADLTLAPKNVIVVQAVTENIVAIITRTNNFLILANVI